MSNRISRINNLIKQELSKILLRELDFPKDVLVTLTRIETSIDLREAKVYISVIPEEQFEKVLKILNKEIFNLQQKLNQRLKMKIIPKLKIIKEEKTKEAAKIEEILESLKRENRTIN